MTLNIGVWVRACVFACTCMPMCKNVYVHACVFMSALAWVFVCVIGVYVFVIAYAFMSVVGVYVCECVRACVRAYFRELCIKCHTKDVLQLSWFCAHN